MDTENKTSGENVENNDAQTPETENTSTEAQEAKEEETKEETNTSDNVEDTKESHEEPEVDEDEDDDEEDDSAGSAELLKKLRRKNSENKKLRDRAKTAEAKALKYEVAAETNIPLSWASRLQGNTKEDLLKDAESLLETFGQKAPARLNTQPNDGAKRGEDVKPEEDMKKLAQSLFSR